MACGRRYLFWRRTDLEIHPLVVLAFPENTIDFSWLRQSQRKSSGGLWSSQRWAGGRRCRLELLLEQLWMRGQLGFQPKEGEGLRDVGSKLDQVTVTGSSSTAQIRRSGEVRCLLYPYPLLSSAPAAPCIWCPVRGWFRAGLGQVGPGPVWVWPS